MNGRTKNLCMREPEGGSRGLAAVLLSFGLALAVFTAAGTLAGCSLAGVEGDASGADASGSAPLFSGGETTIGRIRGGGNSDRNKEITVRFVVTGGGWGLNWSKGIVSPADDSSFAAGGGTQADDFYITIKVPAADTCVNVRWYCEDSLYRKFWVKGTIPVKDAGTYAIAIDLNEDTKTDSWDINTKNLEEVSRHGPGGIQDWLVADWETASSGSLNNENPEDDGSGGAPAEPSVSYRDITVNFAISQGGWGIDESTGLVSPANDAYFVYGGGTADDDYSVAVPVPEKDEYVNVRWRCTDPLFREYWVKGKMYLKEAAEYKVAFDYNGNSGGWDIAVKNLKEIYRHGPDGKQDWLPADWDAAFAKSVAEVTIPEDGGGSSSGSNRDGGGSGDRDGGGATTDPENYYPEGDRIIVKFDVSVTGAIKWSQGIVSTAADNYFVNNNAQKDGDFNVEIRVPPADNYVNIRWYTRGTDWKQYWVKGKLRLTGAKIYTVGFIFNGGNIGTENLEEVSMRNTDASGNEPVSIGDISSGFSVFGPSSDWYNALALANSRTLGPGDEPVALPVTNTVHIKVEVLNGGSGLTGSVTMISTQDDSLVIYDKADFASDYWMSIEVPDSDQYLNVLWACNAGFVNTILKAKLAWRNSAGTLTITIDYNGYGKAATKNLYSVEVGGESSGLWKEWKSKTHVSVWDVYKGP